MWDAEGPDFYSHNALKSFYESKYIAHVAMGETDEEKLLRQFGERYLRPTLESGRLNCVHLLDALPTCEPSTKVAKPSLGCGDPTIRSLKNIKK